MSWLTQWGNYFSPLFMYLLLWTQREERNSPVYQMNTKHTMTFSGFQSSQTRETKLKPNHSAVSWSGLFWSEMLNYLCEISLQHIIQRDRFHPLLINTISRHILPSLLTLFSLRHNVRHASDFGRPEHWISQDKPWQLCSELLHLPYKNRYMYFPSLCHLIRL